MKSEPAWQQFSLHFKQSFDGAYGYLDHCGEFVALIRERFGFYSTEAIPTGCSLELPEAHTVLTTNANELALNQEAGKDDKSFLEIARFSSETATQLFKPFEIYRNTFTLRLLKHHTTLEKANADSLVQFGGNYAKLAEVLSLQPNAKEVKYSFRSGSYELDVQSQSVVISVTGRTLSVPQNRVSKAHSSYVDRVRESASRRNFEPGYGIMLTLELSEESPATGGLESHLQLLRDYSKKLI